MVTQKLFLNTLGENARPDTQNRSADGINLMGMYLQTLDYFTEHHRNRTWNPELQNKPELTIKYLQHVYKAQEVRGMSKYCCSSPPPHKRLPISMDYPKDIQS